MFRRTFFDRISILVKYNSRVFLGNWRKITRFSWERFSIEWKNFNYKFNSENDRKKTFTVLLKNYTQRKSFNDFLLNIYLIAKEESIKVFIDWCDE